MTSQFFFCDTLFCYDFALNIHFLQKCRAISDMQNNGGTLLKHAQSQDLVTSFQPNHCLAPLNEKARFSPSISTGI